LRYVRRYIPRPTITINPIEAYHPQFLTFNYIHKTHAKQNTETLTLHHFISPLIPHIPHHQFKTIPHYPIYSTPINNLSKNIFTPSQYLPHLPKHFDQIHPHLFSPHL
ncbi:transposase, partial [Siminovitchia fortis]|uniref:transposase n=1 Tax=Siminovitchia fortis TaxID=254758 RepID=UPI0016427A75